jgi:tetratricopeptide (TPR) repeat protein
MEGSVSRSLRSRSRRTLDGYKQTWFTCAVTNMSDKRSESANLDHVDDNAVFKTASPQAPINQPPIILWLGLGGLLLVALLVVFVLPVLVTEYELPLERRVDIAELVPSPASRQELEISPFEEAQRSIQRKNAQDVLAELLEIQGELSALDVVNWGQRQFEEALSQASTGDEYYRTQEFLLAVEVYGLGRDTLAQLRASVPAVIVQTLIEAESAFIAGDALVAEEKYALALLLDSFNEAALIGLERSRTLSEVVDLLNQTDDLIEDGGLDQARDLLDRVVSLDGRNLIAPAKRAEVVAMIREREFSSIMSAGYTALETGDPDAAITQFEKAANMGINQNQALAAITQAENEIANAEINVLRRAIDSAENAEQWQEAVDNYDKVLIIDSNLSFAINGKDYATKRERLNSLLLAANSNPQRLAEDDVYQQTIDVYYTGRAIDEPGSVLSTQLDLLEGYLENSQIPINVQFISDNLTDVTLLRIEHFGLFEQQKMSLKPGNYVAVGKRPGYREVRKEFVVGFDQTPSLVIVQCDEPIAPSNRR